MQRTIKTLGVLLLWPALALSQPVLSPDSILRQISETGHSATLAKMYEDEKVWRDVLSSISMGDTVWLKVAVELNRGSDAGPGEQLIFAVGEALEHQPSSVLQIAAPTLGLEQVCGGPDVDDKRYDSYTLSIKAIETRKSMLRAVSDVQLINARERCITVLEHSKVEVARFYGVRQ